MSFSGGTMTRSGRYHSEKWWQNGGKKIVICRILPKSKKPGNPHKHWISRLSRTLSISPELRKMGLDIPLKSLILCGFADFEGRIGGKLVAKIKKAPTEMGAKRREKNERGKPYGHQQEC